MLPLRSGSGRIRLPPDAIIWDNGEPDGVLGFASDFDAAQQQGDDFMLAMPATAGQIEWWGVYDFANMPSALDNFTIRFFLITAGVPAPAPLFSYAVGDVGREDTGEDLSFGQDIYRYSAIIPETPLLAGSYLLSIVNDTTADADDDWFWATSSQSGTIWFRSVDGDSWQANVQSEGASLAFNISEPPVGVPDRGASALLLGLGFVAIWVFRRG